MNRFLCLCITVLISWPTTPVYAQSAIGAAVAIDDRVTGRGSRKISKNSKVYANERIRANDTGLGHFKFNDDTKIVVGPGSSVVLDELVYNPNRSSFNKFVLSTSSGAMRFISGNSAPEAYEVKTPLGVLGIRGTAFDVNHYRGRTYIMMIQGSGEFCSNTGECETLNRRCEFIVISTDGSISRPIQARNSPFGQADMRRFFPLINNQSPIETSFRLRVNPCISGRASAAPGVDGANDPSGPAGDPVGGDPAPSEPSAPDNSSSDNDTSGDNDGDKGGDTTGEGGGEGEGEGE